MSLFKDRSFLAAGFAHLGVDLLNSQQSVLLAYLSGPLALTNSIIGVVSTIYTLSASISQPLFGWLADRFGTRWVATAGVIWLAAFFGAAVLSPGYQALILLIVSALGSAAFHPAGTMEATVRGKAQPSSRETTATSLFFLFGQAGLSFGPMLGGPMLDRWGTPGLLLLLLIVIPSGVNAGRRILPRTDVADEKPAVRSAIGRPGRGALIAFIALTALRGWIQFNFITFLPKYFRDLGLGAAAYGFLAGLFMGASAIGNVTGGWLGDQFPRYRVVMITLALGSLPILLFATWDGLPQAYLLVVLTGALTGASHSIVVVTAQKMMPRRMGAASGMVLGFTFAAGSLGAVLSGVVIDTAGYSSFFIGTAILALIAAGLSYSIRSVERAQARVQESDPLQFARPG